MRDRIKLRAVIQIIVAYLLFVIFLFAWPIGIIDQQIVSGKSDGLKATSPPVMAGVELIQEFQPQSEYLESITIYVENDLQEAEYFTLMFYLFNQKQEMIFSEEILLDGAYFPGTYTIEVAQEVSPDEHYVFLLNSPYEELFVGYVESEATGAIETMNTYVNNEFQEGMYAYAVYQYVTPVTVWWIIAYGLCSIFFVGAIGVLFRWLEGKYKPLRKRYHGNQVIKGLLNVTILTAAISLMFAIFPKKLFGEHVLDLIVFQFSTLVVAGLALYYVNVRLHPMTVIRRTFKRKRIQDYIQIFGLTAAFAHACNYVNAVSNYTHYLNTRRIIAYLLLVMITMVDWNQLKKLPALVVTVCSVVIGLVYYFMHVGQAEYPEFVSWEAVCVGLGILVIYHLLRFVITKRFRNICYWYLGAIVVFWILLNVFAYGRTWPMMLVFPIGAFYLYYNNKENRTHVLHNMNYAIMYHFVGMVIYCLLHRPYHFYMRTRYPMYFHTVTVTAMYLALVFAVVFLQVLRAYSGKQTQRLPIYLALLGAVVSYILMTASRTGIAAMFLISIGSIGAIGIATKKCQWKVLAHRCGGVLLAIVIVLPFTFTMTRIIPSIINDPREVYVEVLVESIVKGEPSDSHRYITVERYVTFFLERMGLFHKEEESNHDTATEPVELTNVNVDKIDNTITDANQAEVVVEEEIVVEEEADNITNGRTDIWAAYLDDLNMIGHEAMGPELNGEALVHAHNSFLQIMYDHGIIAGILGFILYIVTLIRAFYYYKVDTKNYTRLFPGIIAGAFGIVSIAEWAFHPCIPIGMVFLLVIAPLIGNIERKEYE